MTRRKCLSVGDRLSFFAFLAIFVGICWYFLVQKFEEVAEKELLPILSAGDLVKFDPNNLKINKYFFNIKLKDFDILKSGDKWRVHFEQAKVFYNPLTDKIMVSFSGRQTLNLYGQELNIETHRGGVSFNRDINKQADIHFKLGKIELIDGGVSIFEFSQSELRRIIKALDNNLENLKEALQKSGYDLIYQQGLSYTKNYLGYINENLPQILSIINGKLVQDNGSGTSLILKIDCDKCEDDKCTPFDGCDCIIINGRSLNEVTSDHKVIEFLTLPVSELVNNKEIKN